jgi:ubiquinone/menaquinone biosynthesis C-methylase UbiE
MKFTVDQILKLYESEAHKHGLEGTSTIQDIRTRRLEMQALFGYVQDGLKVLEIGCGNGYVAEALARAFDVELDAFDFSADMVRIAQSRRIEGARGRVRFYREDVLRLDSPGAYDLIFSERCVQNLATWDEQKQALARIVAALRPGGRYVMLESFWTGLNNLNAARAELELPPIAESWHNRFFEEPETRRHMAGLGCELVEENRFLSGYYFGSRVLLPALMPAGKEVTSKSILNDFFAGLPPSGDFSPMKILVFRKPLRETP